MASDAGDIKKAVQIKSLEHYIDLNFEAHKDIGEVGTFNSKLLCTLSGGAIVTIVSLMSREKADVQLVASLASYLHWYLLILLLATANAGIRYFQTVYLARGYDHEHDKILAELNGGTSASKNPSVKWAEYLNNTMIVLHILAAGFFFFCSFYLVQDLMCIVSKP